MIATTTSRSVPSDGTDTSDMLLQRRGNPHRPCLENRAAYQWEMEGGLLGGYNGSKKNRLTLDWLSAEVLVGKTDRAVLDVGSAYGNMLLMLNSKLGKQQEVKLVGVDLHPEGMAYGEKFAEAVPGYRNCHYQVADLRIGLPFAQATFDAVNLGDVIEHMENPDAVVRELIRVTKPGGAILISTPLKGGLFKRLATLVNWLSGGLVYKEYYRGKDTELDLAGRPVMKTAVGHDHISEMTWPELKDLMKRHGLKLERWEMMPVMSGSRWFDRHLFPLAGLVFVEALHSVLRFPSWAHGVMLLARTPSADGHPV